MFVFTHKSINTRTYTSDKDLVSKIVKELLQDNKPKKKIFKYSQTI